MSMKFRLKNQRERKNSKQISAPVSEISCNGMIPRFSFEFLYGRDCVSNWQMNEKADVLDTLYRISSSTWSAIYQMGKSGCGYEQIPVCELRCNVPSDNLFLNIEKATVFHRKRKLPVIGYRVGDTFYVFWIDRTFDAYKHE